MEKKTLSERLSEDIMTNNLVLNHNAQCKDCMFRDKTSVNGIECGWEKCFCEIYEEPEYKPDYVYENAEPCECYEKN